MWTRAGFPTVLCPWPHPRGHRQQTRNKQVKTGATVWKYRSLKLWALLRNARLFFCCCFVFFCKIKFKIKFPALFSPAFTYPHACFKALKRKGGDNSPGSAGIHSLYNKKMLRQKNTTWTSAKKQSSYLPPVVLEDTNLGNSLLLSTLK